MSKYDALPVMKLEIEQLNRLIDLCNSDMLKASRDRLEREYSALIGELNSIKEEDPEIFEMIWLHDIKRKDWQEVYDHCCPGEYHAYPDSHCRKKIERYLKKHKLI